MVNSNAGEFSCPICNKCLKSSGGLTTHLLVHSGIKPHKCSWCNKRFTQKGTLVRHEQIHTAAGSVFSCEVCSKTFTRKDRLQEHSCTHLDLRLKCQLCAKTFGSKRKLSHHLMLHSADRPYKCVLCESAFVCASYLSAHRRKVHNVKNIVYQCDCCRKFCKSQRALTEHKKSHSSERPYICHLCPHTSKYSHNFRIHLRQHECAQPYICQVCLKAFSSPSTLYQHNQIHLGKRDFQCEKCGKHFQRQHHLQRHSFSHSDVKRFACRYCGKTFKYRNGLKVHSRTHTGARPYVCDLCGWQFAQKGRMKSHRLTHTGEKPFKCVACGKAFCRHDKLTDHCRRMHKQDVAAALEHAAKVEVEQDDVIGGGAVGVGFFETKHQPTDDATKSFTDTADDVGTGIGNQSNARDDFAAKAFGANSPEVTVATFAPKASNEYSVRCVGAASRGIAAAEPLRTRSGRSYGKSTGPLLLGKHLIPDRLTSRAATGDGGARTEIYGEIDPEKIDDKDVTEIVEIIDITPVDPFAESNFTDSERRSVYSSDESESEEYCRSPTENEDEIDSQPYCESSDTEGGGVGERFGSSADNPSKSGYSQNPNEIACVLRETCSIQNDDEDFLFAMRIFERLKELSSDDRKNSVKVKIEKILMHNSNNTT